MQPVCAGNQVEGPLWFPRQHRSADQLQAWRLLAGAGEGVDQVDADDLGARVP